MSDIKAMYDKSKEYSDIIISKIDNVLSENKINHKTNSINTEILIESPEETVSTIYHKIVEDIGIEEYIFDLLIDIVLIYGDIYIRLKTQ